jgi:hypothetical protein
MQVLDSLIQQWEVIIQWEINNNSEEQWEEAHHNHRDQVVSILFEDE